MVSQDRDIHFLGIEAASGQHFHAPLRRATVDAWAKRQDLAGRLLRYGYSAGSLSSAGWGVVFPRGVDPRIRQALGPLLDLRQEAAGDRYQELIYSRRRGRGNFLSRLRNPRPGPVDPRRIPYYLLLVGSPTEIPHGFQFDLDVQHVVGRLSFDSPGDYALYANAVVRHERAARRPPGVAIFAPSHQHDQVTDSCVRQLAGPLSKALCKQRPEVEQQVLKAGGATRQRLLSIVEDPRWDLVFTVGHATCFAADDPGQRRLQGSLVCADWPGSHSGPVELEQAFGGDDVPGNVDLTGRIFFLFGCYTAGTPKVDSFGDMNPDKRRLLTEQPFVAGLPQKLLAHPAGSALAVIGHVDRAWPTSFEWDGYGQIDVFEDSVKAILDGVAVGSALEPFRQRFADLAVRMSGSLLRPGDAEIDRPEPTHLWTAYNDARSFALLGDPAVSLRSGS